MDEKDTIAVVARMRSVDVGDVEVGLVASGALGCAVEWDKVGWGDVEIAARDIVPALSFVARWGLLVEGEV